MSSEETPVKTERDIVRKWCKELDLSSKQEKDWRKDSERVVKIYRGEDCRTDSDNGGTELKRNAFNILWTNTETMRPALYNSTPQPVCRRRFRDESPVGKAAAEVLERALSFSIDAYDFDERISLAIDDYLLPGRGVTRVRYIPTIEETEGATEEEVSEEVTYEEVICEHVHWEDFRRGPGQIWSEVPWIAFRHKLSRKELVAKFGDVGKKVPLNITADGEQKKDDEEPTIDNRGEVWEIWDKAKRKVYFICEDYKDAVLKEEEDPLTLMDFFPIPRPIYSLESTNTLVPVPEYHQYETMARELNRCTSRIMNILDGLRLRGVYDSTMAELADLFAAGDNKMIPAQNVAKIIQQGGIDSSIWMMPVKDHAAVLMQLYQYRTSLVQAIYEMTGISDIMRGSTAASETATAQQIKSNFGTLRLQRRQREVQRYIRDLMRLKAEIIGENFSIETLRIMTGLEYMTAEEKATAQQMMQFAQMQEQQGMPAPPVDPKMAEMLEKPTWEEIKQIISNDMMRQFKVGIETDSTIAEQMASDKTEVTELLGGVIEFMTGIGPLVASGAVPVEAAKAMLMAAVRRFKLGSEVEDALDKIGDAPPQQAQEEQKPDPELEKQQMEMQRAQMEHQQAMEMMQAQMQFEQMKHDNAMAKIQAESQKNVVQQQAQAQDKMMTGAA